MSPFIVHEFICEEVVSPSFVCSSWRCPSHIPCFVVVSSTFMWQVIYFTVDVDWWYLESTNELMKKLVVATWNVVSKCRISDPGIEGVDEEYKCQLFKVYSLLLFWDCWLSYATCAAYTIGKEWVTHELLFDFNGKGKEQPYKQVSIWYQSKY